MVVQIEEMYGKNQLSAGWRAYLSRTASDDPQWHLYGSLIAWKLGEIVAAHRAIERAFKCKPKGDVLLKCRFQYGDMLRRMDSLAEAIQQFDICTQMLETSPLKPLLYGPALYNLGLCQSGLGNHVITMKLYQLALIEFHEESMQKYERMCLQNMAWTEIDMGCYDEAQVLMSQAMDLDPDNQQSDALYAYLHYRKGDYAEATRMCEETMWEVTNGFDVPLDVQSIVCMVHAEIGLAQGNIEGAFALAGHALDISTKQTDDKRCFRLAEATYRKVSSAKRAVAGD